MHTAPLNIATLRLSGDDHGLDDVIRKLNLEVVWRAKAGEPRRRGGVHETANLNCSIADAESTVALMIQIRSFLANCLNHKPGLFGNRIDAELDVGIGVGNAIQFVSSISLLSTDIRDLSNACISFSVTAYPISGENNSLAALE